MRYMGGKHRNAKHILQTVLKDRTPGQLYVEPFVGGCNVIDKVKGERLAADSNEKLIEMWKALQAGWVPPLNVSEQMYQEIRTNESDYEPALVAFVAIGCSFAGKWWGGYARDRIGNRNFCDESRRAVLTQVQTLDNVKFVHSEFLNLEIPDGSLVYCDPPYNGATGYKDEFDSRTFWDWCEQLSKNNTVYVSEYNAPANWQTVWSKPVSSSLTPEGSGKRGVEKLFTITSENNQCF